jgi:hypothetical protein
VTLARPDQNPERALPLVPEAETAGASLARFQAKNEGELIK